jgi:D-alanyl-D-alanine carboxypeptidase/D-alanyl-D-alanine-endopeptidase (penicillin-binding protein 4)
VMRYPRAFPALLLLSVALAPDARAQGTAGATGLLLAGDAAERAAPAVGRLRVELSDLLQGATESGALYSAIVVSIDRGDTLFALNPDLPLAPASNMKIYTTGAALYYLGPGFRHSTRLMIDGDVRDGVLHGNVILYGTGDPAISDRLLGQATGPFILMADALREIGVSAVAGDVIGDGSWFDAEWLAPNWESDDRMSWYAAPVGALSFAENVVRVRVQPGAQPGDSARVTTLPATIGLALRNEVATVASGPTRVSFDHQGDAIVVRGTIRRAHRGVERTMPVADPANYAAAALRAVLEDHGIAVAGRTRSDPYPATGARVIAEHRSPPLSSLAAVTNRVSHNLFAEALLKTLGRTTAGEGSFAAGAAAVEAFLAAEMPDVRPWVSVIDGSGLSRPNRVTTRATVTLLDYLWRSDHAGPFVASLPQAGRADGLRRMYDLPAAGNVRAKTGTISGVSALSGYVTAENGERLVFSIVCNRAPRSWRAKSVEDAFATSLAGFTR